MRVKRYTIEDLAGVNVNYVNVSVPLVYIDFTDGQHVGPLLNGTQSVLFVKSLLDELEGLGRDDRDAVLRANIQAIRRYFQTIEE